MRFGTTLRVIVTIVSTPFLVVLYLNIEKMAEKNGWDAMLSDRLITYPDILGLLVNQNALNVALAVVAFCAGVWSHWVASKLDSHRPTKEERLKSLYADICAANDSVWDSMRVDGKYIFEKRSVITDHKLNSLYFEIKKLGIVTPDIKTMTNTEYNFVQSLFLGNLKEYAKRGQLKLAKEAAKNTVKDFKAARGQLQLPQDTPA